MFLINFANLKLSVPLALSEKNVLMPDPTANFASASRFTGHCKSIIHLTLPVNRWTTKLFQRSSACHVRV